MTRRKTYQKGSLSFKPGKMSTFRIREFDHQSGGWVQRRFQIGKFKDKKNAQKACEPIRTQVNERNNTDPKKLYARLTFKEFIETYWKAYSVSENHQDTTISSRNTLLKNHMLPAFGGMKLRDIKPADIGNFMVSLQVAGYAANTKKTIYNFLKVLFSLAKQYDLIKKSPVRPKRHRPKSARVDKPTITAAQIGTIIGNLPNDTEKLLVLLISLTAIRIGEALALRWIDFDPSARLLTINHTIYRYNLKKPKTECSKATLRLDPVLTSLLVRHSRQSRFAAPLDYVFSREDGESLCYETCLEHLRDAIDATGIQRQKNKHGFHLFRHTAASELYNEHRDLKAVQKLLRHANVTTTSNIYVHPSLDVVAEGLEVLAGKILPNCDLLVTEESDMIS